MRNLQVRFGWRARRLLPATSVNRIVPRDRIDLLNLLINRRKLGRYLEIGVSDPLVLHDKIAAREKVSVDPAPSGQVTHRMTSDEFFAGYAGPPFDLVFVDGLHREEQVRRDIENALGVLSARGVVVVHDCDPSSEASASEHYDGESEWSGTTWKAWAHLRATRPDLRMQVVDIDHGCGVIEPMKSGQEPQELFTELPEKPEFAFFQANRALLLNLVSAEAFVGRLHRS